jgi:hypothetical protein
MAKVAGMPSSGSANALENEKGGRNRQAEWKNGFIGLKNLG